MFVLTGWRHQFVPVRYSNKTSRTGTRKFSEIIIKNYCMKKRKKNRIIIHVVVISSMSKLLISRYKQTEYQKNVIMLSENWNVSFTQYIYIYTMSEWFSVALSRERDRVFWWLYIYDAWKFDGGARCLATTSPPSVPLSALRSYIYICIQPLARRCVTKGSGPSMQEIPQPGLQFFFFFQILTKKILVLLFSNLLGVKINQLYVRR